MSSTAELMWSATERSKLVATEYLFFYDPVGGLTDIDFHPIVDSGWKHLRCPDDKMPALLVVTPTATFEQIQQCLEHLADKGGFKTVRVSVERP